MFDPIASSLPDPFVQQQAGQDQDVLKLPDPFAESKPAKETKADVLRRLGKEEGVTDVTPLLAIGNQELGNSMRPTVSGAGAIGGMQVLPATGLRYVTPQEWATDEGKMRAGVRYYKDLLSQFNGNEQQAIAGYFTGHGNVNKAIKSGANLPNTLDPIANLRTPQYVNQVQQKIDKNIPDDVKALPDPFATGEDVKGLPDPFAKSPAPIVNVGAPGRNVGPALTPAQLGAAEPWRDNFDTRKYLPKDKSVAPVAAPNPNQGLIDSLNNPVQGQEVSTVTNQPTRSLAERAGGQANLNAARARFTQQQAIRQTAFQDALNAPADQKDAAIKRFADLGPITENEQQQLGITPHYLQSLARPFYSEAEALGGGVAQLGAKLHVPGAQSAADYLKAAAEEDERQANIHGVRGNVGDILGVVGRLAPQLLIAHGMPEGAVSELAFPAMGGLSAAGRGGDTEAVVKGTLANAAPIAGAKLFAGAPLLGRVGANIAANEFVAGMSGAKEGKDLLANAIMSGVMSLHGKGETPINEEAVREVAQDSDLQQAVLQHSKSPTPETAAIIHDALIKTGLTDEQAAQFTDSLKSASSTAPEPGLPASQESVTTPESLTKENQNAVNTGIEQRNSEQQYQGTSRGADIRENGSQVRATEGAGTVGGNRAQESGQEQVSAENEPQVLTAPRQLHHESFGRVTESADQSGVAPDKIRVTDDNGDDHIIQNPRTAGNRSATFVKPEEGAPVASVKAFITKADEANLKQLGYNDDDIYRMKPADAQQILDSQLQKPVEFEAPKRTGAQYVENKSILEAVRALGRIKVDQDTIERGELSQFGNKEAEGQNLIGPSGKLDPDYMREALEQAGFRDPGSSAEPGSQGSLSLDGMYELMDQEQRHGEKVYGAFRDSNNIDADLAAEYEKHSEAQERTKQFEHEQFIESEWADPDSPISRAFDDVATGKDPDGEAFRYIADKYKLSPETTEEAIRRAINTRENGATPPDVPGISNGSGEETAGEGERVTGIKNAITDAERAERGLSPIEKDIYDEFPKVFDDVKRGIDTGKIDIRGLTKEWAEHPKALSENEEAALIYDRARLYNNKEELIDEVMHAIATGDKATEVQKRAELAPIEDAILANEKAAVRTGTIWGRSGAMRQRMMKQDYSLANIERRFRAKTGDSPTPEQTAKFKGMIQELDDAKRALAKRDNIISDLEARIWTRNAARKEAASARGIKRADTLGKIKNEWDNQKDQLVRLLKLQGPGGPDQPRGGTKLPYSSERGAVDPNLVTLPADVTKLLIEMARNRIRAGFTDAVDIVDRIHQSIRDEFDITKRQIADAISGYGKQSKMSTDPVEVQLREVKRIQRLMSALEDAQKGEAPQRSGLKRDKPTQLVRELTRQVNEALRKQGIEIEREGRSPEEQYQSALDGVKTRLRNQIEDLNKQIETGAKTPVRTPIKLDKEAQDLRDQRDALRDALVKIEGPRKMTPEQRQAATERALEKSIADNESRIAEKRLMPDGKPEPANSPRIEELRKRNEEVKKALEDLRANDPTVQAQREAAKLQGYHKQLDTREADLNRTLADIKAGTYEPPTKRSQRNDPQSLEARARIGKIEDDIEKELLKAQLAKRNWKEKSLDFAVKWRRNLLLSNPLTLAKLATAAASRVAMTPVEEAAGAIIGQVPGIKQIAAKAPREGGASVKAEAAAILAYTRTLADIAQTKQILKTGKTNLDLIYGTKADLPPEAIEFFGRTHKVMKAPAQAAEYARSFQKQIEWALENKLDPTDPVTLAAIGSKAYLDSQRAILMQDNMAVTGYRRILSFLREPSKTRPELQRAPNIARALEFMLPIVKVPTNFVAETANYAGGLAKALNTFRRANWDVSKLTPEEADTIMRSLKKQFVGVGLFALGYASADKFGGYYQQDEKRKEGAPKAGELQLFGHNIPHWLLHSPAMEVMQMGATFKHVIDAHQDQSTLGRRVSGGLAATSGLLKQVPFLDEPQRISDAMSSNRKFGKFFGETARDMVIPPAAKMYAAHQDAGVVRKPNNPLQDIEMAIPSPLPFNRKNVPTEADRKQEKKDKAADKRANPDADKTIQRRLNRIP